MRNTSRDEICSIPFAKSTMSLFARVSAAAVAAAAAVPMVSAAADPADDKNLPLSKSPTEHTIGDDGTVGTEDESDSSSGDQEWQDIIIKTVPCEWIFTTAHHEFRPRARRTKCHQDAGDSKVGNIKNSEQSSETDDANDDMEQEQQPYDLTPIKDLARHKILGEGQFGQVWLVSELLTENVRCPYALKIHSKFDMIQNEAVELVRRERDILMQLYHPFIVKLLSVAQDADRVYMLQDFCCGGELFSVIHENETLQALDEVHAKFYAACIADALAYMHRHHVVYRDLKGENVLLDERGYPVLVDFNSAKVLNVQQHNDVVAHAKTYTFCGTPRYLPPEVINNDGHDTTADYWSLGVLIYEMLTGDNPFYNDDMDLTMLYEKIMEENVRLPARVSAAAGILMSRLLEKDPARRLGCAQDAAQHEEETLQKQVWFRDLDWNALRRKQTPAPRQPNLHNMFSTKYFDKWSELESIEKKACPKLTIAEAALFEGF